MSFHKSFPAGGGSTGDATAEQWHIKNGKTAYIASGKVTGNAYTPAMMQFDGSTGYYNRTFTSSGDLASLCIRFARASFTGGGVEVLGAIVGPAGHVRAAAYAYASDHADTDRQGIIQVVTANNAGTNICRLISPTGYLDGNPHTLKYDFSGSAGTAIFRIDGDDADDSGNADRIAPTTGTLNSGASSNAGFGADHGGNNKFGGQLGFIGYRDAYLTNWSDFMQSDGTPKNIEATLATVWGATPPFWHESAKLDENKGSAGNMTKNGSIILAPASSWS